MTNSKNIIKICENGEKVINLRHTFKPKLNIHCYDSDYHD